MVTRRGLLRAVARFVASYKATAQTPRQSRPPVFDLYEEAWAARRGARAQIPEYDNIATLFAQYQSADPDRA